LRTSPLLVEPLALPEVAIVHCPQEGDVRGFFSETYNKRNFAEAGIDIQFVQDNHTMSTHSGTLRGLHFQIPPFAQDKLVRVVRGAIFDVAVDIRVGSPTYGRHVSAILSVQAWNQILIPAGFAHGLVTLEPYTEVIYKVSNFYSPEHDKGLLWNDQALGIDWPVRDGEAILSEKDQQQPKLSELPVYFHYQRDRARS
jgi:dTDP-4-dehydrorhamnose 3,5-epimerase